MTGTVRPLALFILASWAMIFLGSFIVFKLIVPIPDFEGPSGIIASAILKGLLATILVLLWLFSLVKLRDAYITSRRALLKERV